MPDLTFIDRDGARYQVRRALADQESERFNAQLRACMTLDSHAMERLAALQELLGLLVPELPQSRLEAISVGDLLAVLTWWKTARYEGAQPFVLTA